MKTDAVNCKYNDELWCPHCGEVVPPPNLDITEERSVYTYCCPECERTFFIAFKLDLKWYGEEHAGLVEEQLDIETVTNRYGKVNKGS